MKTTKEAVIKATSDLADEKGLNNVSLKAVAQKLNIRTPSLYNHIESLDNLLLEVAHNGMRDMNERMMKIVGFNFDIDLSVWDHTVITEENRFYIGIKMPDGMYHSFHGINKNGNVGTLLYVHGNENARYIESEDCITISELTEKFIKAEISFDKALDIVKKKKIIYAPDATMQAMLSDKKGRVLIIEPGIGYRYEQENFSLITNYSILKPDITKPYIVSGDTRYEVAKELLAGYDKDFSVNDAFKVLKSVSQKDLWATRVSFVYSTEKNKVYYVLNNDFSNVFEFQF